MSVFTALKFSIVEDNLMVNITQNCSKLPLFSNSNPLTCKREREREGEYVLAYNIMAVAQPCEK